MGGLERIAIDLACRQKNAGHQPSICCISAPGALAAEAESAGIPIMAFRKAPGFSAKTILKLAYQLSRERVDVVHTHNTVVHHYGALAAWLARIPVVVNTLHGSSTLPVDARKTRHYKTALRWTDMVVMVSEETQRYYVEREAFSAIRHA